MLSSQLEGNAELLYLKDKTFRKHYLKYFLEFFSVLPSQPLQNAPKSSFFPR